jgi:hypothetical protein
MGKQIKENWFFERFFYFVTRTCQHASFDAVDRGVCYISSRSSISWTVYKGSVTCCAKYPEITNQLDILRVYSFRLTDGLDQYTDETPRAKQPTERGTSNFLLSFLLVFWWQRLWLQVLIIPFVGQYVSTDTIP